MIGYLVFRLAIAFFSLIPIFLVYKISDGLAFLFLHVFKYRRTVIEENLKNAFPEKSPSEIKLLIKKNYQHLADILVEAIKGMSMTEAQINARFTFVNGEILDPYFERGESILGVTAHYNNWEWSPIAIGCQLKHEIVGIYKPIKNKRISDFATGKRTGRNVHLVSMKETRQIFEKLKDVPTFFVLIADQSPANMETAIWLDFLNQDTACLQGPDIIPRERNLPVFYFQIERVGRGKYEAVGSLLVADPSKTEKGDIVKAYMAKLEERIIRNPENWLWSHRRWKRKRTKDLV